MSADMIKRIRDAASADHVTGTKYPEHFQEVI
jgi:hypothetical protein